ncbi:recombinase family protein [Saccharopolyspora sp. NFXS83]|uniref:recombinase family protein n=1 Tax=Saccharopolyspora sp. NFXS83 TaxID=2993560 RepID=UPI00224B52EA|nr:recombinase family protein [Saccharopolyspora sp. NFXS83]MCX2729442.1 recombinase family protein [Saccharopolyspora sp. NFXS83]
MVVNGHQGARDVLVGWAEHVHGRNARPTAGRVSEGLRFAFYGRTSTRRHQHGVTSAAWQRDAAVCAIAGQGRIVAEYFDVGCSRRLPWRRRPRAAALLAALDDAGRGFDAVVIGEYERAFTDDQFARLLPVFEGRGVEVWLPEAGGRFDAGDPRHQALMTMLGAQAQREVLRSRQRVLAAMRAQTRDQGRYLGGRPPYGYRLGDAGPHPNQAHARWGRRMRRLEPDPATAGHVHWMFARRLSGVSIAGIARALNDQQVPCPSELETKRHAHRGAQAWRVPTVTSILSNPRYTGRQVWNRQHTCRGGGIEDESPLQLWNLPQQWVISKRETHEPLVSEADFVAVQHIRAARGTSSGETRTYLLAGLVRCGLCERRMDSHWANDRPGYRCRHGHTSTRHRSPDRPRNLYVREDDLQAEVRTRIVDQLQDGKTPRPDTGASELARFLRAHNLIINYSRSGPVVTTDRT